MYYTVIKHSGHLRTLEKCRIHAHNTRLRLPYLLTEIKSSYNARSDWLEQRVLSQKRARVDNDTLASRILLQILKKMTQIKHPPVTETNAINANEFFLSEVNMAHEDNYQ